MQREWPDKQKAPAVTLQISMTWYHLSTQGRIQGEGAGGAPPLPPPGMTCDRFLINTVQSLDRHTKSALSFDIYSQQFTLCYFLVVFAFKIFYVIGQ